jgi:photosystem II stability/assembly factor-like uncharacterized protein
VAASQGLVPNTQAEAFAVHPSDPDLVYAATDTGVYVTTNGGGTWESRNDGLTHTVMHSIALDPTHPRTLYAGSGSGVPGGILSKSTDGGDSWVDVTGRIKALSIDSVAFDPTDTRVVYAGGFSDHDDTLYKSTDGGRSWRWSAQGIAEVGTIKALAIDPSDPSVVLAGGIIPGPSVYRSTDGGATWSLAAGAPIAGVGGLAFDPSYPSTAYAGAGDGVYRSDDGGASWTRLNGSPASDQLVMDPLHPTTLYASHVAILGGENTGVFKTTNAGSTWRQFTLGLGGTGGWALAIHPTDPEVVYMGPLADRPRVWMSTEGGHRWTAQHRGLGETSLEFTALVIDHTVPSTLYASSNDLFGPGVFKSTNGGRSWAVASESLYLVWDLVMDPTDTSHLIAGATPGVFESIDGANSWHPLGLPRSIRSVAVDPSDPDTMYAGTWGDEEEGSVVFRTIDRGLTWKQILRVDLPSRSIYDLEIDPVTPEVLYAAVDSSGIIHKSFDGGETWAQVGEGVVTGSVNDVAVVPDDPQTVYAGTSTGVFVTHDGGETWSAMSDGMFRTLVYALATNSTGSRLYASVAGGGVFRFDVS